MVHHKILCQNIIPERLGPKLPFECILYHKYIYGPAYGILFVPYNELHHNNVGQQEKQKQFLSLFIYISCDKTYELEIHSYHISIMIKTFFA